MRERRRLVTAGLVQKDLPRRVRDVILAANHVRHLHQGIVDDDGEVVGGNPVGSNQHRIADNVGPFITCAIGFAANRQLAKMACKAGKPNGNLIWRKDARGAEYCFGVLVGCLTVVVRTNRMND